MSTLAYNCIVLLLVFVEIHHSFSHVCEELTVPTKYGKVRGKKLKSVNNQTTFYAFKGIPYARPPIGELRFQPPKPPNRWTGVLKATEDKVCLQLVSPGSSEDCLYLNVYTPKLGKLTKLPVMVWIYGGYFLKGEASIQNFGPDYLIENDVVVVTLNYRLGVFGFLSTEDEASPGNYAIKDQLFALKWVKENIANFGGDPDQITVFGESAGSAATSYLVSSPLAQGLFHKAIMQSGTVLSLWSLSREPKRIAFAVGERLGIKTNSSATLVAKLREVDARTLLVAATAQDFLDTITTNVRNGLYFAPSVEPAHDGAVITGMSHDLLRKGQYNHVPIVVGYTSGEGNPFVDVLEYIRLYLAQYDADPEKLIPIDMHLVGDDLVRKRVAQNIRDQFFGNTSVYSSNEQLSFFLSSDQFFRPTNEYVKLVSQRSPVYFYKFAYEGQLGDANRTRKGVGHGEDLKYIWRSTDSIDNPNHQDQRVRNQVVKLWTNFAKHSNPTPQRDKLLDDVMWPASNPDTLTYLLIDSKLSVGTNPDSATIQFWSRIYEKNGHPPYDTY